MLGEGRLGKERKICPETFGERDKAAGTVIETSRSRQVHREVTEGERGPPLAGFLHMYAHASTHRLISF